MGDQRGSSEARLRRLEDLEEIRDLFTTYARCLDGQDFAGYAALFAPDGILEAPLGRAAGRAAIRELLEARLGGEGAPRRTAFHLVSNPEIALDGDRASARVLWAYVTAGEEGLPTILQLGHYDDELVREEGCWRIARHAISRDLGFSPLAAPGAQANASEGGSG